MIETLFICFIVFSFIIHQNINEYLKIMIILLKTIKQYPNAEQLHCQDNRHDECIGIEDITACLKVEKTVKNIMFLA